MNIKPIKVILHTKCEDDEILKRRGIIRPEELPRAKKIWAAWDGIEVYVDEPPLNEQIQQYPLIGWDEKDAEIDGRVKEAIWEMEQDPVFGTYYEDREKFDFDWAEGKYEPAGSIVFEQEDIEVLEETPEQRLARMILTHPDLRVVPMTYYEVVAGDECTHWAGSVKACRVRDYTYGEAIGCTFLYRDMATRLVDELTESVDDPNDEVREAKYLEARQQAWKKVNAMRWKRALFVEIDLPEMIEDCEDEILEAMRGE